jgi:hypothetical protein
MKKRYLRHLFATLLIALVLSGCASTAENIKQTGEWEKAKRQADSSLVVGRIQWIENGEEKAIGSGMFSFSVRPGLLRLEDRSRHFGEVDEGGWFAWSLQPGTYVMHRINYRDPWSGNYFFVPKVAFRIPEAGKIYYVGTLRADFKSKRDLIGGLSGMASIKVLNELDEFPASTLQSMGAERGQLEMALMVHEGRLPATIDTTPEYQLTIQLLNTLFH